MIHVDEESFLGDCADHFRGPDRKNPRPLHRQLYEGYRAAIMDGTLRPGQRIPASRILAAEPGISRIPILNAYAQLTVCH